MKKHILLFFLVAMAAILTLSCSKPASDTANPYDGINKGTSKPPVQQQIDSSSITGIYTFILSKKCAIPSCHGKSFEPDFSSVDASYNTLVYHKVIKNNALNKFLYRVVPGDTAMSWLHERLVTDDSILGRMPRYLPPLSQREMHYINKWIMNGAKDANGNSAPAKPNNNIQVQEVVAYDASYNRWDTSRPTYYSPFHVPANSLIHLYFYSYDAETKVDSFLDNKVKFSSDPYDFSTGVTIQAVLDTTYHVWHLDINTSQFPKNKQVYIRYYGRVPDHSTDAEYPNNNSQYYQIDHFSFFVK